MSAKQLPIRKLYVLVVVDEDADEYARAAKRRVFPPFARVLHGLVSGFEEQALLRIDVRRFARRDPEEGRVELIDVVEEASAPGIRASRRRRIGGEERIGVPTAGGHLADGVSACAEEIPEAPGAVDSTGQTTPDAYDGNRFPLGISIARGRGVKIGFHAIPRQCFARIRRT
jgi:hypothetical protein